MNRASAPLPDFAVERPHWIFWLLIPFGLGLLALLACSDRAFALWSTAVTGLLPQPLLLGVLVAALVAHVGEALHAAKLAQALGSTAVAGWALQTLLLGYPSLRLLLRRRAS